MFWNVILAHFLGNLVGYSILWKDKGDRYLKWMGSMEGSHIIVALFPFQEINFDLNSKKGFE